MYLCVYHYKYSVFLVAGDGLEPPTSGKLNQQANHLLYPAMCYYKCNKLPKNLFSYMC